MIIWRGFGILVPIVAFVGFIMAELLTRAVTSDNTYYQAHTWPKLVGSVIAASFVFGLAKILALSDKPKIVIDKATGQELHLTRGDALFFVPVRFWPYIVLGFGVLVSFIN